MPAMYPLDEVKRLAKHGLQKPEDDKVAFPVPKKSLNAVVEAFQKLGKPVGQLQAQQYILNTICELTEADFYRRMGSLWGNPRITTDQYGIRKDGIPWFIKFFICKTDDVLEEVSFHPAEEDMALENKSTIKKDWTIQ